MIITMLRRELGGSHSRIAGRDEAEIAAELADRRGPERILDLLLRTGPYGDAFGEDPDGLTLARLEESPHGVDLGPLEPRLPGALRTASGQVELAPEQIVVDVPRLREALGALEQLLDAQSRPAREGQGPLHRPRAPVRRRAPRAHDGAQALLRSAAGRIEAPVEITDAVMPGVVSLPHGWGHDAAGMRMDVATAHAGVNRSAHAGAQHVGWRGRRVTQMG